MLPEFLKDYLPIILFLIIALGLSCAFVLVNFVNGFQGAQNIRLTMSRYTLPG